MTKIRSPGSTQGDISDTLQLALKFVNQRPLLRQMILAVLSLIPALKARIESIFLGRELAPTFVAHFDDLTQQGQQIYLDLLDAIEQHHSQKDLG